MSLSMAQLRSEALEHLGIDATDLDSSGSANLDLLINRSWWELLGRVDFKEKEQTATFNTVQGTRQYSIQTIIGSQIFESISNISLKDLNTGQHLPLDPISQNWYDQNYNETTSLQDQPTGYFHFNGNLILYPTPNTVYTVTLWYNYILTDLSASSPAIPQEWHEVILYGAVARGHRRARDFNSAKEFDQLAEISFLKRSTQQAKDDSNMKMAGVQVYRNTYSLRH